MPITKNRGYSYATGDQLTAELLADPAFRAGAEAFAVDVEDTPRQPAKTVGQTMQLDAVPRTCRRRSRRSYVAGPVAAANLLRRLPSDGETIHGITDGSFVGLDLVPAILTLAKSNAVEVILSTLSFSKDNVDALRQMLDSKRIGRLTLLCSTYFRGTTGNDSIYTYALEQLDPNRVAIVVARCHAKVALVKTITGHKYVVEGSGNLRSCLAIEQFSITRSTTLYNFHRRWIRHVQEVSQ